MMSSAAVVVAAAPVNVECEEEEVALVGTSLSHVAHQAFQGANAVAAVAPGAVRMVVQKRARDISDDDRESDEDGAVLAAYVAPSGRHDQVGRAKAAESSSSSGRRLVAAVQPDLDGDDDMGDDFFDGEDGGELPDDKDLPFDKTEFAAWQVRHACRLRLHH